jgi:murein DD-endopeptidase MepM/ murein hydrolase activator NlpD
MIFPFPPGKQERIFYLFLVKVGLLFFISVVMIGDFSRIPDWSKESESSVNIWAMFDDHFSRIKQCFVFKTNLDKIDGRIRRGDTLINALTSEGVEYSTAFKLFHDIKDVYNLKNIFPGQTYSLYLYQGDLKKIEFEISYNRSLSITKDVRGHFSAEIIEIPIRIRREVVKGIIKDSLFISILSLGEKPELADMMASLYEYDIDFNRDIRDGDCFSIMVEKKYLNREFIKYGHILAAKFTNQGKTIDVVRYTDPEGKTAYYHPDGRAVKKMFLRCPLPFMRVTSRYGLRRHPVLGFSARHNGVDFAAPGGTTVRATASGLVLKTGYDRVRGRYILVRHPNRYVSHYYHLRGIKNGIRIGSRVEQGQVIGFVGKSGRATGFHLHYGLQKNGRFLNPLLLKSPTKNPLKKVFLEDFKLHTARIFFMVSNSKIIKMSLRLGDVLLGYGDRGISEF